MTMKDIKLLLSNREEPSISIYIPTYINMPDKLQNPIKVKNTVEEAIKEFSDKYPEDSNLAVIERLNKLVDNIDYTKTLRGIVIFVNSGLSEIFYTPFNVDELITVSDRFNILDLLKEMNYSLDYWLLLLDQNNTRLLRGKQYELREVIDNSFPYKWLYEVTNDSVKMAVETGDAGASYETELELKFMRDVDKELDKKLKEENLPIILVGTDRNISDFKQVSKNLGNVIGEKHENLAQAPVHIISNILSDGIKKIIERKHDVAARNLETARNINKYTQGLTKVLNASNEGRVHTLFISSDISLNEPKVIDTLMQTIDTNGELIFVDPKVLKDKENIAAILRW